MAREIGDHRNNPLSDVLASALAGHAVFEAGVHAADENNPSARKLARLIERCESICGSIVNVPLGSPIEIAWTELRAAIEEAKR